MQQLLEVAQAQLAFVAQTDETINPDLRDMRLIVEAINDYDSKLYAKSNSSASQEIPDFHGHFEEASLRRKQGQDGGGSAGICAGYYNRSLNPPSSAEASMISRGERAGRTLYHIPTDFFSS